MRLFVGIDLEEVLREKIATYVQGVQGFAPEARWVSPQSLHLTLKFIGDQTEQETDRIGAALASIQATRFTLRFRGYGFFPNPKLARVFWLAIEAPAELANLAEKVDASLVTLGLPREEHAYSPHLTLARSGSGAPRVPREPAATPKFQRLQEKLAALPLPDFGTMTARQFFLYQSKLSPEGSHYTKLAGFQLGE